MNPLHASHFGIIKASKFPPARKRVVGLDTEDDGHGRPISYAFYDGQSAVHFTTAAEAIAYIVNYPGPAIFFAHNLEYDVGNLFKGGDFGFVKHMVYSSMMLMAVLRDTKNTLQNSQAFFTGSVKDMGEIIGLPKLPFDPRSPAYVIRDAQILQIFMSQVQDKLLEEFGVSLGVSLGQTSSRIYADRFTPVRGFKSYNNPDILNSFYGGRTEIFKVGTHEEPVTDADIHSAYPHAMRSQAYPDCRHLRKSSIDDAEHGVGKFTVHVPESPYPPLPWRSSTGRIYFPTGKFSGWWTYAEMRFALSLGCRILKEHPGVGTSYSIFPFSSFVDTLYEKKKASEAALLKSPDSNEARFHLAFYKIMLVSGFGKLIQHKPDGVLSYEKPAAGSEDVNRVGPFWSSRTPLLRAPPMSNYLWGTHIPAFGRIHLLQQILKAEKSGARNLYCDTDALMYSGEAALDFGPGLGQLSQKKYDAAYFRQAKGYVLCQKQGAEYVPVKVAAKGVPAEHGLDFIARGMAAVMKPVRLRHGLVRAAGVATDLERAEGLNAWSQVERHMRSEYLKRPLTSDGQTTRPPSIAEVARIEAKMDSPAAPEFSLSVRGGGKFTREV